MPVEQVERPQARQERCRRRPSGLVAVRLPTGGPRHRSCLGARPTKWRSASCLSFRRRGTHPGRGHTLPTGSRSVQSHRTSAMRGPAGRCSVDRRGRAVQPTACAEARQQSGDCHETYLCLAPGASQATALAPYSTLHSAPDPRPLPSRDSQKLRQTAREASVLPQSTRRWTRRVASRRRRRTNTGTTVVAI